MVGVVERSTTRPGAAAFGPGWKVGAWGSLKADLKPESNVSACAVCAWSDTSTLNVPPIPALSPGPGEMTVACTGAVSYEAAPDFWTAVPAAETGSQRPPKIGRASCREGEDS